MSVLTTSASGTESWRSSLNFQPAASPGHTSSRATSVSIASWSCCSTCSGWFRRIVIGETVCSRSSMNTPVCPSYPCKFRSIGERGLSGANNPRRRTHLLGSHRTRHDDHPRQLLCVSGLHPWVSQKSPLEWVPTKRKPR